MNCWWVGVNSSKLFSDNTIQCLYGLFDHSLEAYYCFMILERKTVFGYSFCFGYCQSIWSKVNQHTNIIDNNRCDKPKASRVRRPTSYICERVKLWGVLKSILPNPLNKMYLLQQTLKKFFLKFKFKKKWKFLFFFLIFWSFRFLLSEFAKHFF